MENYLKLVEGENVIRLLRYRGKNPIIYGYERWAVKKDENGNVVISQKTNLPIEEPIRREIIGKSITGRPISKPFDETLKYRMDEKGKGIKQKKFIGLLVYNYSLNIVQVAVFTQATLIEFIKTAMTTNKRTKDSWWKRDLTITREGKSLMDTVYRAEFGDEISEDEINSIQAEVDAIEIDLCELFRNGDPFEPQFPRYEMYKQPNVHSLPPPPRLEQPKPNLNEFEALLAQSNASQSFTQSTRDWVTSMGGWESLSEDQRHKIATSLRSYR